MTLPTSSSGSDPTLKPAEARGNRRWIAWTLVWLALCIGVWQLAAHGFEWRELVANDSPTGMLVFALLMMTLPLLGFPISAFYVFAGMMFDPWLIIPIGLLSLAVNMSAGYGLARYVWREPLHRKFAPRWPKLFAMDSHSAARITILVRAIPGIPFSVQNYLLGVLATPFGYYLVLSLLIQGCFLTGVVLTTRGAIAKEGPTALLGGLCVLAVILVLRLIYRRSARMRT